MAVDYAKKKNDELQALCKERDLAHSGKKADLVKRLEDHDAAQDSAPAAAKPAIEDEIDWDDEPATETAKAATTEPAAAAIAAGGIGEVKNPVAVPNQTVVEGPATTNDLTVVSNGEAKPAEEEKVPEKDYTSGIAERTLDEEIEKRKARARKFGLPEDTDEIKKLERAKKFGSAAGDAKDPTGLLNTALSSGTDRKRKSEGPDDGQSRKRGVGKFRGRGGRPGMDKRQPSGTSQAARAKGRGDWMTSDDRAKAEARKQRFAAPA